VGGCGRVLREVAVVGAAEDRDAPDRPRHCWTRNDVVPRLSALSVA
jgi:hypothetical protein